MERTPVRCGLCATARRDAAPGSARCDHFDRSDPDGIWLAVAGSVVAVAGGRRRPRKWVLGEPLSLPTHPAFESVVREKRTGTTTFKLPVRAGGRVHFVEDGGDQFYEVHYDAADPDPPARPGDLVGHGMEIVGNSVHRRFAGGRCRVLVPLYVVPDHRWTALRAAGHADATGDAGRVA